MFYDLFRELCDKKGISVTRATIEIGLSRTIGTKWKQTGATPQGETLDKIADYFGVTTDMLLGKEQKETPALPEEDELKLKVAAYWGGGEDLPREELDELWDDARSYFRFKMREKRKGSEGSGT